MKKQPEFTAQTREKLIEAFWNLYCGKEIEHITIKEITDKAGYHRGTFYEYFTDIYDVLNQLEDDLLEYIRVNHANRVDVNLSEDDIQNIANLYLVKGKYLSVLLGENGDPKFLNKIKAIFIPILMDTFGLSKEEIHTSYIFEFASSGILAAITHWYIKEEELPSQELIGLIRSMLMIGVYPMIRKYSTSTL